ncbi:MAG: dephospho-CoA kinase, partial [Endomicrobium sp.]|nr:dephospho-CoA kinase [Endomicrobium sp.]
NCKAVLDSFTNNFGQNILLSNGTLNRKKVSDIFFFNSKARFMIEKILHPYIISYINEEIFRYKISNNCTLVLINAPLIFEVGLNRICDKVIVVWAPYDVQINRLIIRDKFDIYRAKKIIDIQMSTKKKIELADFVIDNSGSKIDLKKKVWNLFKLLTYNIR